MSYLRPIWTDPLWQRLWPHGFSEVSTQHRIDVHDAPVIGPSLLRERLAPYLVPDDPMDVAFGVGATILVVGGIAYFATPAAAAVFVFEPGTMTISFLVGVMFSNLLQEQF